MPEIGKLQKDFSSVYGTTIFDPRGRRQKAEKALSVIHDRYPNTRDLDMLDIGCAAGFGTKTYGERFHSVVGIDIDEPAVIYAVRNNDLPNLQYAIMDSQKIALPNESFDIIICTHVYEHVPDASKLMSEIYRLLKVGGACYFTAGNRLCLMEPHYRLPFLSVFPKCLAHYYLRALKRGNFYYEKHLTYWALKKLVEKFQVIDYTTDVVRDPVRYCATEVIKPGSFKQWFSLAALRVAYWACPTYLWLLRKVK